MQRDCPTWHRLFAWLQWLAGAAGRWAAGAVQEVRLERGPTYIPIDIPMPYDELQNLERHLFMDIQTAIAALLRRHSSNLQRLGVFGFNNPHSSYFPLAMLENQNLFNSLLAGCTQLRQLSLSAPYTTADMLCVLRGLSALSDLRLDVKAGDLESCVFPKVRWLCTA